MELVEFVRKVYNEKKENELGEMLINDLSLNSKVLEGIKDELLKLDVFSECNDLEIVHFPAFELENGKSFTTSSFKYDEGMKVKGKCYLYSIYLTPEMYDPLKTLEPVKDGASISPTVYNPETFEPLKKIVLTFSPEGQTTDEIRKQELRDLLNKVLDNPKEYESKGTRGVLIRGVFEIVNDNRRFEPNILVGKVTQSEDFIAYFIVKDVCDNCDENRINLTIKQKTIPGKLKDKFIERFDYTGLKELSEEEIDLFLEENK
jgi:hypothetical protein